jgi:hypothetical protein
MVSRLAEQNGAIVDAATIAAEAAGHPFFIRELLRMDDGLPAEPVKLEEVLRQRSARCEPIEVQTLKLLATAGRPLARSVAADAAGIEPDRFFALIDSLQAANPVRTHSPRGGKPDWTAGWRRRWTPSLLVDWAAAMS